MSVPQIWTWTDVNGGRVDLHATFWALGRWWCAYTIAGYRPNAPMLCDADSFTRYYKPAVISGATGEQPER